LRRSRSFVALFLSLVVLFSAAPAALGEEDGFLRAEVEPSCKDGAAGRDFRIENINVLGELWGVSVEAAEANPPFQIIPLSGTYAFGEIREFFLPTSTYDQDDWWIFAEGAFHFLFTGPAGECANFVDSNGHTFESSIEWLAGRDITEGCNPPANDRFCPDDQVTRGQMAAFLVRALGYTDTGGGGYFVDTTGTVFEASIDKLRTAGVTLGCNPPANDRFCPDGLVTRAQMAGFLSRAFGYTDAGGDFGDRGDFFIDDEEHVFERAIDQLVVAGVTRGCNPPVNDRFCPDDPVTRGQMAAFLRRALS